MGKFATYILSLQRERVSSGTRPMSNLTNLDEEEVDEHELERDPHHVNNL